MNFVDIIFASLLANNLLFFHFFGLAEFLQGQGPVTLGRRFAVLATLVVVTSLVYWTGDHFLLVPFHLEVLRTLLVLMILIGVTTAYGTFAPSLSGFWPRPQEFLVHSFLVGAVVLVGSSSGNVWEILTAAVAVVIGYGGALVVLAAVFGRLGREKIPASLQGLPLHLLTLGLVWLVLQGLGLAFTGKNS